MKTLTITYLLMLICFQPLSAQEIGEPFTVDLAETSTTLTLDFSSCDYELILYSIDSHLETSGSGLCNPLGYSVTAAFGDSNPVLDGGPEASPQVPLADRLSLESMLRAQERELASRLQESGGYRPHAAKIIPQQIGSTRQFVFPGFGNVSKTTITASLVASSERANMYVDVGDINRMRKESLQAQIDRFSEKTYPTVTSAFGKESDVDNDGKIHILYTNLVNPDDSMFGAAGFFNAGSLLSVDQGGDGNLSDIFYVDPDTDPRRIDAVLAHEFQHLINFNQHVLLRNGPSETLWLNEGLSHFCEDLIGEYGAHTYSNVDHFLSRTPFGSLGTTARAGQRPRGALYLLVASLVEEFGTEILTRLVQTDKAGFENIETAAGQPFAGILDRHFSRIFLSGLGLNAKLNYSTAPLADEITQARAFPLPDQAIIWPGGGYRIDRRGFEAVTLDDAHSVTVTVRGETHQLSPVYIRLIGNRKQTTITIHTDPGGEFRAQLIPIPVNYQPGIAIPTDYLPRVAFDPPLPVEFRTGKALPVSGAVSDASLSGTVEFYLENGLREINFRAPIAMGKFSKTLFFYPDEVGRYTLYIGVNSTWSTAYNSMAVVKGSLPSPDFDGDGTVGFPDFMAFAQMFGKSWADEDFEPWFDLDLNGEVGFSDFLIFAQAF